MLCKMKMMKAMKEIHNPLEQKIQLTTVNPEYHFTTTTTCILKETCFATTAEKTGM